MISIIIPVYQCEDFIDQMMADIFCQTYQDYEVLLVDDGSTDGSVEKCREYAQKDVRIRVFSKEHSGVSETRNVGIAAAQGEYIAFIDCDDRVEADYLEHLLHGIGDNDLVIASFDRRFYQGEKLKRIVPADMPDAQIDIKENFDIYFSRLYTSTLLGIVYCKLFKRELLEKYKIRFDRDIQIGEDYLFNFAYFKCCKQIRCIPYVGYHYICRGGNSLMHQADLRKFEYGRVLYEKSILFCEEMELSQQSRAGVANLYLRTCFKNMENVYLLQERMCYREKYAYIRRILEDSATKHALKISHATYMEFKIYKMVLYTGSPILVGMFSMLRLQYKRLLGRG